MNSKRLFCVRLQLQALKHRDERLRQMSELLSSVRLVKMYAWEDAHINKLKLTRNQETARLFQINLLDGIIDSIYGSSSSVVRSEAGAHFKYI